MSSAAKSQPKFEKTYTAVPGSHLSDKDAQVIGPELDRLEIKAGEDLSAELYIKAAKSPKSPLHFSLQWDDTIAGDLYRRRQAQTIIASIQIQVIDTRGDSQPIRGWINVRREEGRVYRSIEAIVQSPEDIHQVIKEAREQLLIWRRRYDKYARVLPQFQKKFKPVLKALDAVKIAA